MATIVRYEYHSVIIYYSELVTLSIWVNLSYLGIIHGGIPHAIA